MKKILFLLAIIVVSSSIGFTKTFKSNLRFKNAEFPNSKLIQRLYHCSVTYDFCGLTLISRGSGRTLGEACNNANDNAMQLSWNIK